MAQDNLRKKQKEVEKIPLGTGMAERTKQVLINRQADLDARIAAASGEKPKQKKKK